MLPLQYMKRKDYYYLPKIEKRIERDMLHCRATKPGHLGQRVDFLENFLAIRMMTAIDSEVVRIRARQSSQMQSGQRSMFKRPRVILPGL